ncbi:MAG: hypothetical protein AAGJ46_16190 [Planctomycetota bacterium]
MLRFCAALAVAVAVFVTPVHTAVAFPDFQKAFIAKYVSDDATEYKELVTKQAKCYICHQGKKKKNKNVYGELLDELLDKKDRKDIDKIMAALAEVGEKSTVEGDEESGTYAELIADGKLPVDLETAKKEPDEL